MYVAVLHPFVKFKYSDQLTRVRRTQINSVHKLVPYTYTCIQDSVERDAVFRHGGDRGLTQHIHITHTAM